MNKWAAISLPVFTTLTLFVCLFGAVVMLFLFPMLSLTWVIINDPLPHLLSPEAYAREIVASVEDIKGENIEILQIQEISEADESVWTVLTRYNQTTGIVATRLLFFEDANDGTLHTLSPFYEISQSNEFIDATVHRYTNRSNVRQISVHGTIFNKEIAYVLVSATDQWGNPIIQENNELLFSRIWEREAVIEDESYLLFTNWPSNEFSTETIQVTALNKDMEIVTELSLPYID